MYVKSVWISHLIKSERIESNRLMIKIIMLYEKEEEMRSGNKLNWLRFNIEWIIY